MSGMPILSVSEFNQTFNHLLSKVGEVHVRGELTRIQIRQNNLLFATIKDTTAAVDVFGLVNQLSGVHAFEPGMMVTVSGMAGLYQRNSGFRIRAYQITPAGEGSLKQAYEKLKAQLQQQGLFDEARKRTLPKFPQRIALLTAPDSQAYLDFVKVTSQRCGGVSIDFFPVTVQGSQAVPSIVKTLNYINQETRGYDLIVLTRGGGSLEDLIAFNDEKVVRAVFQSKVPIMCAIGHEGDVSLAELAADQRASTPSNAAELAVVDARAFSQELAFLTNRMAHQIHIELGQLDKNIIYSMSRLENQIQSQLRGITQVIQDFDQHLSVSLQKSLNRFEQTQEKTKQLERLLLSQLETKTLKISHLEELLRSFDYQKNLARGYSIIRDTKGQIVKDISQLGLNQEITTQMHGGKMQSQITSIQTNNESKN